MTTNQRRFLIIAVVVIAAMAALSVLLWGVRSTARAVGAAVEKKEEHVDITALVTQIRNLNRLETASMRVVNVSTTKQSYGVVPQSIGGDELTFMAVGDVIAGIDLSHMTENNVRMQGDTLVLRIPQSEILVTRVDNRQSRVLKRDTGLLRRSDPTLESRARAHAETAVRQEAMKRGILTLASRNAEQRIAELVRLFGAKKIVVETMVQPFPRG
jgi:hypothetical protein